MFDETISKFKNFEFWGKYTAFIYAIIFCVLLASSVYAGDLTYPEEQYQLLWDEADRMTREHSFDTDYELDITSYNNLTRHLEMELSYDGAILQIHIDNYREDNEVICFERLASSAPVYTFAAILALLLIAILYTAIAMFIIFALKVMFLILQLGFIAIKFLINKRKS